MVRSGYALSLLTAAKITLFPAKGSADMQDEIFAVLPATVTDLDVYRWKNRPVLLFARSESDPGYLEQREALEKATEGLRARKIVVLIDTDADGNGALRRLFGAQDFELLLFGQDGGLKLRETDPITAETLFETIDAMPMNRRDLGLNFSTLGNIVPPCLGPSGTRWAPLGSTHCQDLISSS